MNIIDKIRVNTQSSIRMDLGKIWRFDPFVIEGEPRDADYVFITHAHFDHYSPEDLKKVLKADTRIFAPKSLKEKMIADGFAAVDTYVEPGDEFEIEGARIQVVPAYNTNKPNHPKENGWVGYVVSLESCEAADEAQSEETACEAANMAQPEGITSDGEGCRFYVAGDTDVIPEQTALSCDLMLIPVGGTYTMDEAEAAQLINELKPATVIPIHYGSVVNDPQTGERFAALVKPEIKVVLKLFK